MRRIDDRTVELTDEEVRASDTFEDALDAGCGIAEAIEAVRDTYVDLEKTPAGMRFLRYLAGESPAEVEAVPLDWYPPRCRWGGCREAAYTETEDMCRAHLEQEHLEQVAVVPRRLQDRRHQDRRF